MPLKLPIIHGSERRVLCSLVVVSPRPICCCCARRYVDTAGTRLVSSSPEEIRLESGIGYTVALRKQVVSSSGAAGAGPSTMTELTKLAGLYQQGLVNQQEYDNGKARLLGAGAAGSSGVDMQPIHGAPIVVEAVPVKV